MGVAHESNIARSRIQKKDNGVTYTDRFVLVRSTHAGKVISWTSSLGETE